MRMSESRRVYSTTDGDLRKPPAPKARQRTAPSTPNDGIVRVSRETSGRRGKTVTVVRGVPARELDEVASDLKRQCGSGGSAKDGVVEIQGDHRHEGRRPPRVPGLPRQAGRRLTWFSRARRRAGPCPTRRPRPHPAGRGAGARSRPPGAEPE